MSSVFAEGPPLLYLAVGKRKDAKARYSVAAIDDIVAELRRLPKEISLKYQKRALVKAAKPGYDALRSEVSKIGQVTGNLLASVTKLDRTYTNNKAQIPVSVVVVGFRRPTNAKSQKGATPAFQGGTVLRGPNRAYHSHLIERGTRPRTAGKSRRVARKRVILGGRINTVNVRLKENPAGKTVLSSFKTRGPFFAGRGLYPFDFIATGTVKGSPARYPLRNAFEKSQPQMKSILDAEMRKSLTAAVRQIGRDIQRRNG